MLNQPTETYMAWAAALLLLGGVLAVAGGALTLAGARKRPYFQLRRQSLVRGWRLLMWGVGLLVAAGLVFAFGRRGVEVLVPPTLAPTASPTPTLTPPATPTPTLTLTPSQTSPSTETLTPAPTFTPEDTTTPTISPTPALPRALVTPPGTVTVTPPAEAVAGNIRFSRRDNCRVEGSLEYFDQLPKTIYAHFDYDNWLPGAQWSGGWVGDGGGGGGADLRRDAHLGWEHGRLRLHQLRQRQAVVARGDLRSADFHRRAMAGLPAILRRRGDAVADVHADPADAHRDLHAHPAPDRDRHADAHPTSPHAHGLRHPHTSPDVDADQHSDSTSHVDILTDTHAVIGVRKEPAMSTASSSPTSHHRRAFLGGGLLALCLRSEE